MVLKASFLSGNGVSKLNILYVKSKLLFLVCIAMRLSMYVIFDTHVKSKN